MLMLSGREQRGRKHLVFRHLDYLRCARGYLCLEVQLRLVTKATTTKATMMSGPRNLLLFLSRLSVAPSITMAEAVQSGLITIGFVRALMAHKAF